MFSLNTWVASTASGLSTYTSKPSWPWIMFSSLMRRIKYRSSWVLPTAKAGITTLPPRSKVSWMICASSGT